MFQLKLISREGIPSAMAKAERYRLLDQPWAAESICLDVLQVDPENDQARVLLLLCLTDQFDKEPPVDPVKAREVLEKLKDPYDRAYYAGVISERRAKAQLARRVPGGDAIVYRLLKEAMEWYEKAEAIRPAGIDEAILRWNTCARMLTQHPEMAAPDDERLEPVFGE